MTSNPFYASQLALWSNRSRRPDSDPGYSFHLESFPDVH
jgi:hypothetical protein